MSFFKTFSFGQICISDENQNNALKISKYCTFPPNFQSIFTVEHSEDERRTWWHERGSGWSQISCCQGSFFVPRPLEVASLPWTQQNQGWEPRRNTQTRLLTKVSLQRYLYVLIGCNFIRIFWEKQPKW